MHACPAHIDIPTFIAMINSDNVRGAAEVVRSANAFANVCGKICPEEIYCQPVCSRGKEDQPIEIRGLHFFATQEEARGGFSPLATLPKRAGSVGVIGGGPAGLGCAFELVKFGYRVTVYDRNGVGGVPRSSIPAFRLGERELQDDLAFLSAYVKVNRQQVSPATLRSLRRKHDALFLGFGLGQDRPLGLPGENLRGVIPVLAFLEDAKIGRARVGKRVLVIGGGNVSLDAAASAKRLGAAEVTLLYRRSEQEMKVWKSELEEARRQGVVIRFLTLPVQVRGTRKASGLICRRTELSAKRDRSGRAVPLEVKGSEFTLAADTVIVAIGQVIAAPIARAFKLNAKGFIHVDRSYRTSVKHVFAGGDAISGEGTIVQSVGQGKEAARAIHSMLSAR
jgi:NADPH-dependent glutamate synthase beta subunit-like oxidoreductase